MKNRSIVVGIFVVLLSAVSLACSKTPVFSQAGIDKIREYNKAGDRDRAIAAAQKYLSANPNDSEVLTILGENYGWKKNFASAEKSLKKAIRIQPKNTWAIRALTAIYRNQAQEAESPKSKAGKVRAQSFSRWSAWSMTHSRTRCGRRSVANLLC